MHRREVLLLFVLAVVIVLAAYLSSPSMLSGTDFLRIHTFYKSYLADSLLSGRLLPLWNPHVNLGRPFLADADAGLFYPPNLVYLIVDVSTAWSVLAVLHVGLAMVGMARWLRDLGIEARVSLALAATLPLAACFAEPLQNGLVHYAVGLCYLPWVFRFVTRLQDTPSWGTAAWLAVTVALQYLGGHPQVSWIALVGATLFLLGRRMERPFRRSLGALAMDLAIVVGAFAWGWVIAAIQILPTLELATQGNRHPSVAFSASFALPWAGLLSLIQPVGPRFPLDNASGVFCGTAVLVAGVTGLLRLTDRNVRALVVMALFSTLLALGDKTPLFRLCYELLPGCSHFRLHSRMMVLVTLALLAGAGKFLCISPAGPGRGHRLAGVSVLIVAVAVALQTGVLPSPLRGQGWTMPMFQLPSLALSVLLLAAWQWHGSRRFERMVGWSLLLVAFVELSLSIYGIKILRADSAPVATERALANLLADHQLRRPDGAPPRISVPMPYVRENAGMSLGWSTFSGYVSLTLDRMFAFIYGMRGLQEPLSNAFPADNVYGGGPFPFASMGLELGFDPERRMPFLNRSPDPRVYLAPRHEVVGHWRQALQRMERGHDFHQSVLLEQAMELPGAGDGSSSLSSASIVHFTPERIELASSSPVPAWLVLKEAWYPGWSATVDGRPAPCVPGNVWMRVVPLPAGTHQIVLEFRSRVLAYGAGLSLLGMLGSVVVFVRKLRRRAQSLG